MFKNKIIKFFILSFSLLSQLNSFIFACGPEFKKLEVVFVGDKGSGKTWFRKAVQGIKYIDIYSNNQHTVDTIEIVKCLDFDSNKKIILHMYDTSGDDRITPHIRTGYAVTADIVVIAVDGERFCKKEKVNFGIEITNGGTLSLNNGCFDSDILSMDNVFGQSFQNWVMLISFFKDHSNYKVSNTTRFIVLGTKYDLLMDNNTERLDLKEGYKAKKFKVSLDSLVKNINKHQGLKACRVISSVTNNYTIVNNQKVYNYSGVDDFEEAVKKLIIYEDLESECDDLVKKFKESIQYCYEKDLKDISQNIKKEIEKEMEVEENHSGDSFGNVTTDTNTTNKTFYGKLKGLLGYR